MGSSTNALDWEMDELERLILNNPFEVRDEMEIREEWARLEKEYALESFNPDRDIEEIEYLVAHPGSSFLKKDKEEVNELSAYVIERGEQSAQRMVMNKQTGVEEVEADLVERGAAPPKKEDLGELLIPLVIDDTPIMALVDTGASTNYMPKALYDTFFFMPKITPSRIRIKLGDQSFSYPLGNAEDVRVEVAGLGFLADFVITTSPVETRHPIIIGRTFLNTARAIVDMEKQATMLKRWNRVLVFSMKEKEEDKPEENTICMMGKTTREIMDWMDVKRSEMEKVEKEKGFDDINKPEYEMFSFGEVCERICVINEISEESKKKPPNMMEVIERLTNSKFHEEGESSSVRSGGKRNIEDWGLDSWRSKEVNELGANDEVLQINKDDMGIFNDAPSSEEDEVSLIIYKPNEPPLELPVRQALEELVQGSEKFENKAETDNWGDGNLGCQVEVPPWNSISHSNCVDETGSLSLPCMIKNECLNGLVDTGASASVMSLMTYKRLKLPRYRKHNVVLELVNNSTTTSIGMVDDVTVKISDFEYKTSFILVDMIEHPIHQIVIGRPLLRTARALVNLDDDSIVIKSGFRSIMFGPSNSLRNLFQDLFIDLDDVNEVDGRNEKNESTSKKEKQKRRKGKSSFSNNK